MKKILISLVLLLSLFGCQNDSSLQNKNSYQNYSDIERLIDKNDKYLDKSEYLNINVEMSKINDGYRYYIFVDKPVVAMYGVKAMAIIDGFDYEGNMAANFGIFDDIQYNLVPNQTHLEKGYLKGFIMSGITTESKIKLKIMIQWKSEVDGSNHKEFVLIEAEYKEN